VLGLYGDAPTVEDRLDAAIPVGPVEKSATRLDPRQRLGRGMPARVDRPDREIATRGRTASRNAPVDDVRLP